MEERRDESEPEEVIKHVCKLCSKTFPCGRSFGGHMKSHLKDSAAAGCSYRLREKPRKTWRVSEFGGEDSGSVPSPCRECNRKFSSWKGLFAHMVKRHIVNNSDGFKEEDEEFDCGDFLDGSDAVTNSQSSDNRNGFPNRKKRSQRRKRCDAIKVWNSLSSSDHAPAIDRELEEVAVGLMMLSRDFFNGSSSAGAIDSSMVDSSDNNSASFFHKDPIFSEDKDCHSLLNKGTNARTEVSVSGNIKNWSMANRDEISQPEMASGKNLDVMNENREKPFKVTSSSSKRKFSDVSNDSRLRKSSSMRSLVLDGTEPELDRDPGKIMTSRFECNTCKKTFHSYQALGGHRASHSKSKAAFGSEDTSGADVTELSPSGKITVNRTEAETIDRSNRKRKKESKGDEHGCPVCLKVFPSGQALGGHKRSHMPEAAKNSQTRLSAIPKPAHKVRDFLDLNLPAPLEEEEEQEGMSSSIVNFKPWWAGRSHKQEAVIGLVAN